MVDENNKLVEKESKKTITEKVEEVKKAIVEKSAVQSDKAETKKESKIELQREYVIPLRREFNKTPQYRRAARAVHEIKVFLAKHMHVENRDLNKVKIDMYLNEEMWFRGIKNPWHKIKVKAVKKDGVVYAELAEVPEVLKYKMAREQARKDRVQKTGIKPAAKTEETTEQKAEEKEDEKSTQQAGEKENKVQAKAQKHTEGIKHEKKTTPRRQVLQR